MTEKYCFKIACCRIIKPKSTDYIPGDEALKSGLDSLHSILLIKLNSSLLIKLPALIFEAGSLNVFVIRMIHITVFHFRLYISLTSSS